MGYGPVPATEKLLARLGLTVGDLDLIEINEAFAAQTLGCMRKLGLDPAITNVNGGAIALGPDARARGFSSRWCTSSRAARWRRSGRCVASRRSASASAWASARSSRRLRPSHN